LNNQEQWVKDRFTQNRMLMDFSKIPENIYNAIEKHYNEYILPRIIFMSILSSFPQIFVSLYYHNFKVKYFNDISLCIIIDALTPLLIIIIIVILLFLKARTKLIIFLCSSFSMIIILTSLIISTITLSKKITQYPLLLNQLDLYMLIFLTYKYSLLLMFFIDKITINEPV